MRAALETFQEMAPPGRKWLMLGAMRELGAGSREEHAAVGRQVARQKTQFGQLQSFFNFQGRAQVAKMDRVESAAVDSQHGPGYKRYARFSAEVLDTWMG